MLGHRIWGKRLGIIGMGRIGSAVARRARAFGLQIHYHNRRRVPNALEEELEARGVIASASPYREPCMRFSFGLYTRRRDIRSGIRAIEALR